MHQNYGRNGACFYITETNLKIANSMFENNAGVNGGVIFAIYKNTIQINESIFLFNMA